MPIVSHSDLNLNYQLVGPELQPSQPPVAPIHGLGANMAFWYLGPVRHMGRDRSLLLHDMRGHGASSMPACGYGLEHLSNDYLMLLDRLNIRRAHVVGHSHGARVALYFALNHPDRVESLTIADTQVRALQAPMKLRDWPHWPEWKADLIARGVTSFPPEDSEIDFRLLASLGPRGAGGGGGRAQADMAGVTQLPRRGRRGPAANLGSLGTSGSRRIDLRSRQMGARGSEQWQRLLDATSAADELHDESGLTPDDFRHLTMPVFLMYGQMSHCLPTADRLMELLPNARRLLVPEAGHFFPIVKPQVFARGLRMFLARVDTDAARPVSGLPALARAFDRTPAPLHLARKAS